MMISRRPLQQMFEAVPPRYDLTNRLFTFGMDRKWRKKAIEQCLVSNPGVMLDLCCGTADTALGYAKLAHMGAEVLGLDFSLPMLEIGMKKSHKVSNCRVSLMQGNASQMPFRDSSIECIGISFAFRNLTYKNPLARPHLQEVLRVLSPGGKYVIIESSQPESRLVRWAFRIYVKYIVFWLGYFISGNRGAYRYLSESALNYFTAEEVKVMLLSAGFRQVVYQHQFCGAACIHVATK